LHTLSDCTNTTNTVCTPCDASLLPINAAWTAEPGCTQWVCDAGFVREPNTTTCLKCKLPSDCIAADSYDDSGDGCGRCVPCDLYLLLSGQCFNGDGQCGVSYWCEGMETAAAYYVPETTPPPPVAADPTATQVSTGQEVQSVAASAPDVIAYASVATFTVDAPTEAVTPSFIADLDAKVSADCACDANVASITIDNITAFCISPTSCAPPTVASNLRRLLSTHTRLIIFDITLLSSTPLTQPPPQPVCAQCTSVLGWQTYECQSITDRALVEDRRRMAVHFRRTGTPWVMEPSAERWNQYYLVVGIVVVVVALALMSGGGAVVYYRVYEVPVREEKLSPRPEHSAQNRYDNGWYDSRFNPSERELMLPRGWSASNVS
jgi:hypothetical protein